MRILLTLSLLTFSLCANATEINCNKVKTSQDKMICQNVNLQQADSNLAKIYNEILALLPIAESVRKSELYKDQKAWLAKRNACENSTCMLQSYALRQQALVQLKTNLQASKKSLDNISVPESIAKGMDPKVPQSLKNGTGTLKEALSWCADTAMEDSGSYSFDDLEVKTYVSECNSESRSRLMEVRLPKSCSPVGNCSYAFFINQNNKGYRFLGMEGSHINRTKVFEFCAGSGANKMSKFYLLAYGHISASEGVYNLSVSNKDGFTEVGSFNLVVDSENDERLKKLNSLYENSNLSPDITEQELIQIYKKEK